MEYTSEFHMSNDRIDLHGHIGVQIVATDPILIMREGVEENWCCRSAEYGEDFLKIIIFAFKYNTTPTVHAYVQIRIH